MASKNTSVTDDRIISIFPRAAALIIASAIGKGLMSARGSPWLTTQRRTEVSLAAGWGERCCHGDVAGEEVVSSRDPVDTGMEIKTASRALELTTIPTWSSPRARLC